MPKTKLLQIRMTEREMELLKRGAALRDMTVSEFVRDVSVQLSKWMVEVNEDQLDEDAFEQIGYSMIKTLSRDAASADN